MWLGLVGSSSSGLALWSSRALGNLVGQGVVRRNYSSQRPLGQGRRQSSMQKELNSWQKGWNLGRLEWRQQGMVAGVQGFWGHRFRPVDCEARPSSSVEPACSQIRRLQFLWRVYFLRELLLNLFESILERGSLLLPRSTLFLLLHLEVFLVTSQAQA